MSGDAEQKPKLGSEQAGRRVGALTSLKSVILAARAQAAAQAAAEAAPQMAHVERAAALLPRQDPPPEARTPIAPGSQHAMQDTTTRAMNSDSPPVLSSAMTSAIAGTLGAGKVSFAGAAASPAGSSSGVGASGSEDRQELKQEGELHARPIKAKAPSERQKRKPSAKAVARSTPSVAAGQPVDPASRAVPAASTTRPLVVPGTPVYEGDGSATTGQEQRTTTNPGGSSASSSTQIV